LKIVAASSIAEPFQHSPVHAFINRNKWLLGLVQRYVQLAESNAW